MYLSNPHTLTSRLNWSRKEPLFGTTIKQKQDTCQINNACPLILSQHDFTEPLPLYKGTD